MTKNKTATAIAIFMTLTLILSPIFLAPATAHTPKWEIPTWAFVQPVINPVGVGQTTYIYMWIDKTFGTDTALTNDWRFHNYKLTITKPNGDVETKTWDIVWDTTSSQSYAYAPDQAGTYKLKFEFPGQDYTQYSHNPNSAYVNDTFLPSSAEATLTVQEEPISYLSGAPLPAEYWTRPIYGENTDWWSISSDWLGSGSPLLRTTKNRVYIPDGVGPQTSHVMWTKPIQTGGIVGGNNLEILGDSYFDGSAYLNRFVNPIILAGRLFYTEPVSFHQGAGGPTKCVDIRTGEVIWSRTDVPRPSFGVITAIHNPQQHGVSNPMLVATSGSTWMVFDSDTGNWIFNFTSVPSGASAMGPSGEYLSYVMANAGTSANPDWRLAQWNSTKLIFQYPNNAIRPTTTGLFNASSSSSYDWNISIPWRNTMSPGPSVIAAWYNDIMLCYNGTLPNSGFRTSPVVQAPYTYFAVNLNASKGAVGSVLWMKTYNPPIENITILSAGSDPVLGVFVEKCKETNQWVGYSLRTGDRLWGPVGDQLALDYYGNPGHEQVFSFIAYGKVYVSGYSGVIWCYDGLTGNLLWSYGNGGEGNSTFSGFAVPGHYPTAINAIANGVIYTVTTEHTVQTPIYKGCLVRAINATDGTEIWTLSSYTGEFNEMNYAVADGYAIWFNAYDNQIYSVGKGPSALTVTAPDVSLELGKSLVIRGTVIDVSAGTKQSEQLARFPNGVAAVSDESMTAWMEYVYQQQPKPIDATGVPVMIDVIDSNGNYRNIGTATSDSDGFFSFQWTPDIVGKYTVIASFAGSGSYWPSHAETAFAVDPATEVPTSAPVVENTSVADQFFLPAVSGLAVVMVVICVLLAMLLLRKK